MREITSGPGWMSAKAQRRRLAHTGRNRREMSHWEPLVGSATHQTTYSDQATYAWDGVALCRKWRKYLGSSSINTVGKSIGPSCLNLM